MRTRSSGYLLPSVPSLPPCHCAPVPCRYNLPQVLGLLLLLRATSALAAAPGRPSSAATEAAAARMLWCAFVVCTIGRSAVMVLWALDAWPVYYSEYVAAFIVELHMDFIAIAVQRPLCEQVRSLAGRPCTAAPHAASRHCCRQTRMYAYLPT